MNNQVNANVDVSHSQSVVDDVIERYYSLKYIQHILQTTLEFIDKTLIDKQLIDSKQVDNGLNVKETDVKITLPYFKDIAAKAWKQKPKELGVYITDMEEGRELNFEARGKNYATNILSYPSELPEFLLHEMATIPLGELIICHEVVVQQANEQSKTVGDHVTHMLVHGILHLLGFDHELGKAEQDEMESYEIAILHSLDIKNPYVVD